MFFPNAGVEVNPALLLLLGLTVGTLSGFFGVGGGFLITGGLIIFGVTEPYAVGTGLTLVMGSSIINTLKHRKLGNVDFKLGVLMVIGTIPGVEAAKRVILGLEASAMAGAAIRYVYIVVLTAVSAFIIYDYVKSRRKLSTGKDEVSTAKLAQKMHSILLPPYVSLPVSGIRRISIWVPMIIGFGAGFLAGFLGAGGGFILMPTLIYVLGLPTTVAVGTDLFQIVITGSFGALTFALSNRVDLLMALIALAGASLGSQLGSIATRFVHGAGIRFLYALTILGGSGSMVLKQVSTTNPELNPLSTAAAILLLGVAGAMCVVIAGLLIAARAKSHKPVPSHSQRKGTTCGTESAEGCDQK